MLRFYHDTKLESLANQLCRQLDDHPPANPLAEEIFVVQNHGIGQWLSLYLADKEGIAANMKFEFPSERLWSLIRLMDDDIPEDLPSDRRPMTWSLMQLLGDEEFLADFDNLRYYIQDPDPTQRAVRSWKLSAKIADVFDQYLIYRPQMVLGWQQGRLQQPDSESEQWQANLWNRLLTHWEATYDGRWLHRAELQQELFKALDNDLFDKEALPERLSIFGVSTLPPAIMKTMVKLSKIVDVHFYQLSIDPDITDRESFSNPLLQSLGKEQAAFNTQFSRLSTAHKAPLDQGRDTAEQQSVLEVLQSDLESDNRPGGRNLKLPSMDNSIQVHACHSPKREVEVLYDQLLALLDDQPQITPDDILIMTPDIDTYAPMIEAVFESPDQGQPEIPYSIADRGAGDGPPAITSFLKILELCESRFKVTEVLDLLDTDPIKEAFGFTDEDLNKLERWVGDNRIRWGIDGSFKRNLQVPASNNFTWKSGLNRMMLGYVMKPTEEDLFDGLFPYREIETSDDARLAGRFSRFLEELFSLHQRIEGAKSPEEWRGLLEDIADTFLPESRDYFRQLSTIRTAIEQLSALSELGGFDSAAPFAVIKSWIQEQLQQQSAGGGRIGRGVTFSSLMPMRSIPFSVIGMIGMNEGAFPRSKIPIEFDLMYLHPRPGDPVQADEDRNLFLENLLSARQHLYFSYVGRSNRQDAEFPPSVVINELVDYLGEQYGFATDDLLTEHKLQAFSPSYFKGEGLFSYSTTQQNISRQLSDEQSAHALFFSRDLPRVDDDWKQLSVSELVSFFQHPAKFMLQSRLGIYLGEDEVLTEEREPFALEKLEKYRVEQQLLQRFLNEQELESYQQIARSRDMLPEGWPGQQAYEQKIEQVQVFGGAIRERLQEQQLDDLQVNIELGDAHIVGKLTDIYPDGRLSYRFGNIRAKDRIDWWIRHLLFQKVKPDDHEGHSLFFAWEDQEITLHKLSPVENADELLANLIEGYWQGMHALYPFYPQSSYAYAKQAVKYDNDDDKAMENAIGQWEPGYNGRPGEGDDPYYKLIMDGRDPFKDTGFKETSRRFWTPFFAHLDQEEQ
ncbi:MAG: exodeoxyribonuclease V subunit gamma [Fodinibius sp.]|nr:exodeoxyribonuclease V subunit gamma [Fodinibius sp.]